MKNRANSIDLKAIVKGDEKGRALGEAFGALASAGSRLEMLKKQQTRRETALLAEQRKEEREAAAQVRVNAKAELARAGGQFQSERAALVLRQSMEQAKYRAEWKQRATQRLEQIERQTDPRPKRDALRAIRKTAFNDRATPERDLDGRDR